MQEQALRWNQKRCAYCGKVYDRKRGDRRGKFCSNACRQAAYRRRKYNMLYNVNCGRRPSVTL